MVVFSNDRDAVVSGGKYLDLSQLFLFLEDQLVQNLDVHSVLTDRIAEQIQFKKLLKVPEFGHIIQD